VKQSRGNAEAAFVLASLASGIVTATLPSFSKPFLNQVEKERANNQEYKDAFIKSFKNSGLKEKGVTIEHVSDSSSDTILRKLKKEKQIIDNEVKAGRNAYYKPSTKCVRVNFDLAAISGFHECGHAMNHLTSNFGKILQKCRPIGYSISSLMGIVAICSRKKAKGDKRSGWDFVQDNCGKIAFMGMLPTVAEEALASYKGVKMAKQGGLSDKLVKNLKKFYGKALLSYAGYALVTGLSVFAASKITEILTRPKKIAIPKDELSDNSFNYF
jgi:hypothetical protein